MKKGFTLIELMVVIVIIGILAAIAVPKMFSMSAKAKVAEAPESLAAYERLQQVYITEAGALGNSVSISYAAPTSKFFTYDENANGGTLHASAGGTYGACNGNAAVWATSITAAGVVTHGTPSAAACAAYTPNW